MPKKKSKFSDSAPEPVAIVGPAPGPPGAPVPPPAPVTAPVLMTTPNAAYEVPPAYAPVAPGLSPDFSTMPVSIQNQFFHIFNGGMCTAADLDAKVDRYRPQLQAYARAIRDAVRREVTGASLLFLGRNGNPAVERSVEL